MANSIQESINNAISTIVSKRIDALALDKTVIGVIDSIVDSRYGIYKIKCDGGYFNAKSQSEDAIYLKGMSVYVQIPQNDMTKEKLIISRANTLRDELRADVTISAINNFSIIGTNLLQQNFDKLIPNNGLGIRSYHNYNTETEETISHRVQTLYGENSYYNLLDEDIFNLYKQEASAIMVEAEFRTALNEEQRKQSAGTYGIGLNLKFENVNFSIGETQGEVFDYYADQVQGVITVIDPSSGGYISAGNQKVINYVNQFEEDLYNDSITIGNLQNDGGYIDKYKSYILSIAEAFKTSEEISNVDGSWSDIINSYLNLLNDLKTIVNLDTIEKIREYYEAWKTEKINSPQFNNVSFILDSNSMTGNPYNYSDWSTQYAIFSVDVKTLASIDDILFYKDGFILDENKCTHDNSGKDNPREDIFIRNVKVYALKPISAESGDYRLEISSPNGLVFHSISESETLNVVAKVSKSYYQSLTEQSGFYWFKKSKNVTTVSSEGYHQYGGVGWKYLPDKKNEKKIVLNGAENLAYENIYKCVSITDETVILAQEFYVYNLAASAKLKIESDLGVQFNFDSGIPTLTCLINDKEFIINTTTYTYDWAIVVNGQRTFLNSLSNNSPTSINITDITSTLARNELIKNIKFYRREEDLQDLEGKQIELTESEIRLASELLYPISNIGLENSATFECYVSMNDNEIGCASITLSNATNAALSGYHIVIENGDQVFQYDEYGNPPNAEKLKDPIEIKPLICHFFNPAGIEISSGNYTLNWIVPITDSMLIPKNTNRLITNPATRLKEIDNTSKEFLFDIAEFYNEEAQNNQVTCQVIFNNETVTKDTNLFFTKIGENGTNGTDVVARIFPEDLIWMYDGVDWSYSTNVSNSVLDREPLTLYRSWNNTNDNSKIRLTLNNGRYAVPTNYLEKPSINLVPTGLKAHLYLKNEEIIDSNIKIVWNVAGATKTTINNNGKFIEVDNSDDSPTVQWNENYTLTNRILSDYIIKAKITYNKREYYAFYPLCVINYKGVLPSINRISIDKKTLLKEIMYNADGRNPVYTHSQGIKLNNIPKDGTITWTVYGGTTNDVSTTDATIRLLQNSNGKRADAKTTIATGKNVNMIYILPNDEYSGASCNNRVVATVKNSSNTVVAEVIVPIYMHLNTFGLASLNAWDGNSVTIDEDNGYVMAPQIGAGEKDANNRFTGILMGKTETRTGAGQNVEETGLFGYAHGLQSIFLDSNTGNATFGLPDGYTLTSDGNTLTPDSINNNYNEGRVELRPGGESKIGGWKLGHRSLYYTAEGISPYNYKGIIGDAYNDNPEHRHDLVNYAEGHEKDINHEDQGILLSAVPAYISIKGRILQAEDVSTESGTNIREGDSLELQLDPRQRSILSIFVHRENKRTLVSGIDNKGRFIANRLQNGATAGSGNGSSTTFAVSDVWAFGDTTESGPKYVGAQFEAGNTVDNTKTFVSLFSQKSSVANNDGPVYITGGQHNTGTNNKPIYNNYARPITIHGKTIGLYADDGDTAHQANKTTNTRLTLNNSSFYAGNVSNAYISLVGTNTINSDSTINYTSSTILALNNLVIKTHSTDTADYGNIYLQTRDNKDTTTYSYLTLMRKGNVTLQGWTNLNGYAQNGNIYLYARSNGINHSYLILPKSGGNSDNTTLHAYKNIIIDAADNGTVNINNKAENKLLIDSTYTVLRRNSTRTYGGYTDLRSQVYLNDATNGTSYLDAINQLGIRSIGNSSITSKGNQFTISLGEDSKSKTNLILNTGANWDGGSTPNPGTAFSITNVSLGGILFKNGIKPGYAANYKNSLQTNKTYGIDSAALAGSTAGDGNTGGGLYFNWGYFPGRIFGAESNTGNQNYVNTSIYAAYRIVSNTGFRTTQNSSSITMSQHTISKNRSDFGYSSTCDTSGDDLYELLYNLLDEVAYTLNYAKQSKARADSAYSYAGQAMNQANAAMNQANSAMNQANAAYNVGNHSHPYASNSHTHRGPSVTVSEITSTSGSAGVVYRNHALNSYSTGGPQ